MQKQYDFEGMMKLLHVVAEHAGEHGYQVATNFINMATIALATEYLEREPNFTTGVILEAVIGHREKYGQELG